MNLMPEVNSFSGQIVGEIVEVRFAFSGQVSSVNKHPGDSVNIGDPLAALDNRVFQTELDRELAYYARVRAEFELFVSAQGEPKSDSDRFEKVRRQSLLDVSVKTVEIAKFHLDQSVLKSPVSGLVVGMGGLRPLLHVTPSSNPVEILDFKSICFSIPVDWEEIQKFTPDRKYLLEFIGLAEKIPADLLPFIPPSDPKKSPEIHLQPTAGLKLFPGQPGKLLLDSV
jgi:hypothetical protein